MPTMLPRSRIGSAVRTVRFPLALLALLVCPPPGHAQNVVNLSGEIEVTALPPSLLSGQFVNQALIRLLHEGAGVVTVGMPGFPCDGAVHDPGLPVVPGDNTFGNAITIPYGGPELPAIGTEVYSILLHFDPDLSRRPFSLTSGIARSATIEFDQPILGVYVTSASLIATDAIFTPGSVAYPASAARDMEFNYDGDEFAISPDRHTLSLTMFTHDGGFLDEARIILPMAPTLGVSLGPRSGLDRPIGASSESCEPRRAARLHLAARRACPDPDLGCRRPDRAGACRRRASRRAN